MPSFPHSSSDSWRLGGHSSVSVHGLSILLSPKLFHRTSFLDPKQEER